MNKRRTAAAARAVDDYLRAYCAEMNAWTRALADWDAPVDVATTAGYGGA